MKYDVTFSCGHTATIELFGTTEQRERKIKWYETYGDCPDCYEAHINAENAEGCEAVEMSYREYKENYGECKTERGSYNKETKTIVVYVPRTETEEPETEKTEETPNEEAKETAEYEINNIESGLANITPIEFVDAYGIYARDYGTTPPEERRAKRCLVGIELLSGRQIEVFGSREAIQPAMIRQCWEYIMENRDALLPMLLK